VKKQFLTNNTGVFLVAALLVSFSAQALMLDKEIARMPAGERPTPEQVAAAKQEQKGWDDYQEQLWQKLEPQLQDWAKKGKPYLPRAVFPTDLPAADVPAFPGAEGGGKFSLGGRGGKVFVVTNLDDAGPGSFREAVESAGPRVVVFNVAGIIHLKQPLHVLAPYITIDGHTAPGDGVCIAGFSTLMDTHDVVIRYLRFRRGATNLFDRDDCLGGQPIGNIIVDHCSCSWGLDENLSMYRHVYKPKDSKEFLKYPTLNITLQWNISSEALNTYGHAFGGTWGGNNTSFHHNLFACDTGRNPSIGMSYDFNFVDNVIFNWRHRTLDGGDQGSRVNCINNYYQPGPVTQASVSHRIGLPQPSTFKPDMTVRYGKWFAAGNIVEGNDVVTKDNWNGGIQFKGGGTEEDPTLEAANVTKNLISIVRAKNPFPMPAIEIQPAQKARELVLANAGALLPKRDSVDERAVHQTKTGKVDYTAGKGIITDTSQVGGYPEYKGEPFKDVGADGIPLSWKKKFNLDANDVALAQKDLSGDGYTVIEKYLDGLDPTKKIDWSNPKSNVNTLR
jgi:hypothetical protein